MNAPHYSEAACDTVLLAVPPLAPMVERPPRAEPSFAKTVAQSMRSDFRRQDWTTAKSPAPRDAGAAPAPTDLVRKDRGVALTDYLLLKAEENGIGSESYEATRIRLRRADGRAEQVVDVHEMYWADLSRLSGAVPRIVSEIFTMVFRLSRLGRDSVEEAARDAREACAGRDPGRRERRWKRLADYQILLDQALSGLLANTFLQLLLSGLLIAGLGQALPHAERLHVAVATLLPALAAWWWWYSRSLPPARLVLVLAAAAAAGWGLSLLPAAAVVGTAYLALLAYVCDVLLRVGDRRFPGMRAIGLLHLALTCALLLGFAAARALEPRQPWDLHAWIWAGMRTVEFQLAYLALLWLVLAVLLFLWMLHGELAPAKGDAAGRASVATGRLGLFASFASFLLLAMALWALLTTVVEASAAQTHFEGVLFPLACPPDAPCGAHFLHERYMRSTQMFAVAAVLTLLLLAFLVVMLVPSVLAELRRPLGSQQALGRWLSGGYRLLEPFVSALVLAAVLVACVVGAVVGLNVLGVPLPPWTQDALATAGEFSQGLLKPLVFGTATAAALLSVFGRVLSRTVPGLRAPLDIALDVDNHFREFPRRAIPRVRIFSRYVALLEHIAAQGYDRIVIVAHSQGTVITTELLRYLRERARQPMPGDDRVHQLWNRLEGRIDLLTAGSPLRQLYAARFPHLYAWVLAPRDRAAGGPLPEDVGAQRWINLYTSGDYVGRWVRADLPPAYDTVCGQAIVYDAWPGRRGADVRQADICIGPGAHTHYFELGSPLVAEWIDTLVADAAAPDAVASATDAPGELIARPA